MDDRFAGVDTWRRRAAGDCGALLVASFAAAPAVVAFAGACEAVADDAAMSS